MVPVEEGPREDGRLALDQGRVVLDGAAARARLVWVRVRVRVEVRAWAIFSGS